MRKRSKKARIRANNYTVTVKLRERRGPAAQNVGFPWLISMSSRLLGPNLDVKRRPTFPLSGCLVRYLTCT